MESWPEDVGILALEFIFPSEYVDQKELEEYDGVSAGKYTVGLGQDKLGFCRDREDINSICLTVVQKLIENHNINYEDIGRLEVGTETIIDKSKSVKTVLMQLFEPHGITDIEGIDTTNACYGGTAALFNAINWIESSSWNGRYALVVAADIAVYDKGSARPTSGAGAVAMLIGPNAPLVFDRGMRATFVKHAYDFYKPDLTSEYPYVDGKLSLQCYLNALDECYQLYVKKMSKKNVHVNIDYFDAVLFHSPYCKLVQKSLSRLVLNDFILTPNENKGKLYPLLKGYENVKLQDTYFDREIEKAFLTYSRENFEKKTHPSLLIANQVGNTYTSSLYGCLVSFLINHDIKELAGKKVGLFSYGSGLAASFFTITITKDCNENSAMHKLVSKLGHIKLLLSQRHKVEPAKFEATLDLRQTNCHKAPHEPLNSVDYLFPGTYYLTHIDEARRRFYKRIPNIANNNMH